VKAVTGQWRIGPFKGPKLKHGKISTKGWELGPELETAVQDALWPKVELLVRDYVSEAIKTAMNEAMVFLAGDYRPRDKDSLGVVFVLNLHAADIDEPTEWVFSLTDALDEVIKECAEGAEESTVKRLTGMEAELAVLLSNIQKALELGKAKAAEVRPLK
jgi:hypothetical protein